MSELGHILREARKSKGITLDEMQTHTKIQKRHLEAIENGEFEKLPGKFYSRAFIKQYAEAIGLDSKDIFVIYHNEIPSTSDKETTTDAISRTKKPNNNHLGDRFVNLLPKIILILFIVVIAISTYYFATKYLGGANDGGAKSDGGQVTYVESEDQQEDSSMSEEKPVEESETTEVESTPDPPPQQLEVVSASGKVTHYQTTTPPTADVSVKIVSSGETWVSVDDANGDNLFEEIITSEEPAEFVIPLSAASHVEFTVGNAPQTEIYINNQLLEYELPPSEVDVQTLIIDSAPVQ